MSEQLESVYRDLEMPLIPVLVDIERAGVLVDQPLLASQSRHLEEQLASFTARIYELAQEEFNINSPQQLGRILFEKLAMPVAKKTGKTRSFSTAAEVLEELALVHELPKLVLEWRGLQKLKSTYIDALPLMVHPVTGRVHTSFNQAIAATGTPEQLRAEPAEHSNPHGARSRHPARVRCRSGIGADFRRLLAD